MTKIVERKTWYRSIQPSGDIWTETKNFMELLRESLKWEGPGDLRFETLVQKIVYHEAKIEPLEIQKGYTLIQDARMVDTSLSSKDRSWPGSTIELVPEEKN